MILVAALVPKAFALLSARNHVAPPLRITAAVRLALPQPGAQGGPPWDGGRDNPSDQPKPNDQPRPAVNDAAEASADEDESSDITASRYSGLDECLAEADSTDAATKCIVDFGRSARYPGLHECLAEADSVDATTKCVINYGSIRSPYYGYVAEKAREEEEERGDAPVAVDFEAPVAATLAVLAILAGIFLSAPVGLSWLTGG